MSKVFLSWVLLMVILAFLPRCFAKDLGSLGPTYPILEENFLTFIEKRIQTLTHSGKWQSLQQVWQAHVQAYRDRPTPLRELTPAHQTRTWLFDPSIVLTADLLTPSGTRLAAAGTHLNPLHYCALSNALIFLNGDDVAQMQWAKSLDRHLKGRSKIILVNGSLLAAEHFFAKPVYFDQAGQLTQRFGIHHIPSWIVQKKDVLQITEVKL